MNWANFEEFTQPPSIRNLPVVATLTKGHMLYIGKILKDAGFDAELKYKFHFARENNAIGLQVSDEGIKPTTKRHTVIFYFRHFCKHFGITGRHKIEKFEREGDFWILYLPKEKEIL